MYSHPQLKRLIVILWIFAFLLLSVQVFLGSSDLVSAGFGIIVSAVWAFLFCLPIYLVTILQFYSGEGAWVDRIFKFIIPLTAFSLIIFLFANFKLYSIYGFYTNYFVINLVTTPGGIEAMGISASTWNSAIIATVIGAAVFWGLIRFIPFEQLIPRWLRIAHVLKGVSFLFLLQGSVYIYADYVNSTPVLNTADRIIWYLPITADSILENLGVSRTERFEDSLGYSTDGGALNYFDPKLISAGRAHEKFNVVWLVAESWRADMVTEKVMPNTFAFANEQQWFKNHYSGGNGTRMGLFTQFYGIYGNYWFDMLRNRRSPLLMEQLRSDGYDFKAITSSAFTYPEFDKTIFSSIPESSLQAFSEGHGWERDQKNTADLVSYIESADKPFFAFMFFESSHANYYFPDEDIIEEEFLDDFNYLTVDLEESMGLIKSRYVNATHHLDRQLARVYKSLEEQGLMDNTIVVVTGDHGEEFMEKGRWGHNSTFSQEQIRVPMIVHIPDMLAKTYEKRSSHLDMPATILSALGYEVEEEAHSFGHDLLDPDYQRDYLVVSDWHGNTLVTEEVKIIFSLKGASYHASVTNLDDEVIDLKNTDTGFQLSLSSYLQEQNRFFGN